MIVFFAITLFVVAVIGWMTAFFVYIAYKDLEARYAILIKSYDQVCDEYRKSKKRKEVKHGKTK